MFKYKFFPTSETRKPKEAKKKKLCPKNQENMQVGDILEMLNASASEPSSDGPETTFSSSNTSTQDVALHIELENLREELQAMKLKENYQRQVYSVAALNDEVIRMETGLTKKR